MLCSKTMILVQVKVGLNCSARNLKNKRISFLEDSITLVVNRYNVVQDTINQMQSVDGFNMHKEIKIFFVGEEAQDAGGVFKEWIFLVLRDIFNSYSNSKSDSEEFITTKKKNLGVGAKFKKQKTLRSNAKDSFMESNRNHSELCSNVSEEGF